MYRLGMPSGAGSRAASGVLKELTIRTARQVVKQRMVEDGSTMITSGMMAVVGKMVGIVILVVGSGAATLNSSRYHKRLKTRRLRPSLV
jgi:hypothetical protein